MNLHDHREAQIQFYADLNSCPVAPDGYTGPTRPNLNAGNSNIQPYPGHEISLRPRLAACSVEAVHGQDKKERSADTSKRHWRPIPTDQNNPTRGGSQPQGTSRTTPVLGSNKVV